jgi:hypothetical protein
MALSPQLLQYKSSGVYRLEFDKSQTANIPAGTLRLVVGHSRKGPYNSPVLISTTEQFIEVFGSIDRNLEKKGMFFHRSALAALTRGPILALNLANFTSDDKINYTAMVTDTHSAADGEASNITVPVTADDYSKFFNTEKFWSPSDEELNAVVGTARVKNALRFANIKQDDITVIVRQAQDVKAFEILARDWYGEGEVPAHMNAFDYISDYMVDIFVFKGDFNTAAMATDPVYGEYFDQGAGLKKDKINEFANLRQVSLLAKYTGSILPGFSDKEGNNLYIESIVNAEARRTGLFCAVLEDAVLDGEVDLIGHDYDAVSSFEMLSYSLGPAEREYALDANLVYDKSSSKFVTFTASPGVPVVSYNPTAINLPEVGDDTINEVTTTVAGDTLSIVNYDISGDIAVGDFLQGVTGYVEVLSVSATDVVCDDDINSVYDAIDTTGIAAGVNINKYEEVTTPGGAAPALVLSVGDYIKAAEARRMVKVTRIAAQPADINGNIVYEVYTSGEAANTTDYKGYKSFESAEANYVPFAIAGATIIPESIKGCLNAIALGSGLANALIDKDTIDFRYIVDTFGSWDTNDSELLNKVQLSALAKERQNASAIVNAPSIADFKKSSNPTFKDDNGKFDINYITTGGNLDKNPTSLFALPGINDGANYAFYYTALIARENNKDIVVPSAAYVSNNFIDKYTDSSPWAIVAGPRRGVISGSGIVGAEYAFDKADRDVLEPFGINPIVFQRGAGLTILGNKTAQQSVQSALSSAHVREVLIYIQDGLAAILKDYVFEFNTPQTRLEIKTLADSFLESVKADSGVYEFKNVMDSTNNTNEVIDANIGILDTFVEPVKGLEIVVQRTTVLNTGEIATGNFS